MATKDSQAFGACGAMPLLHQRQCGNLAGKFDINEDDGVNDCCCTHTPTQCLLIEKEMKMEAKIKK